MADYTAIVRPKVAGRATGDVSGEQVGGFVRVNSGVVTTSHWDAMTTGQTQGFGTNTGSFSATGLAIAQLQAGLAPRFDPTAWAPTLGSASAAKDRSQHATPCLRF